MSRSSRRSFPDPPAWFKKLCAVGVTGTNGKTSTTRFLAAALGALGTPVVSTTTLGSYLDDTRLELPQNFQGFLDALELAVSRGGRHCVLELTSEVLGRGFTHSFPCRVAVFTNLTRDHLDVHTSPEHYLASKAQLFATLPAGGHAVLNAADPACELLREVIPPGVEVRWYASPTRGAALIEPDLAATAVDVSWHGTRITLHESRWTPGGPFELFTPAIGEVYAENALAAFAGALSCGVSAEGAAAGIRRCAPPPGRFELVAERPHVVVDYAHSPDALARSLGTARRLARGAVTVVFGAGGNRDSGKRALLGAAARAADRVLLTSDNPRDEDPRAIIDQIREGLRGQNAVEMELDRTDAIRRAVREAAMEDVVLIAGKGHESTQVIAGVERRLSDREVALSAFRAR